MVNPAAFYAVATLIVAGALAAIALPGVPAAAGGLGTVLAGVTLLEALSGAWWLAALQLLVLTAAGAVIGSILRRPAFSGLVAGPLERVRWWPLAVALGAVTAVVVGVTFAANGGGWYRGAASADLLGVLRTREPLVLGAAALLLAIAATGCLSAATVTRDEHELGRRLEERRLREERARRRREDRLAARRNRGT